VKPARKGVKMKRSSRPYFCVVQCLHSESQHQKSEALKQPEHDTRCKQKIQFQVKNRIKNNQIKNRVNKYSNSAQVITS
jgi:hypothetical protein